MTPLAHFIEGLRAARVELDPFPHYYLENVFPRWPKLEEMMIFGRELLPLVREMEKVSHAAARRRGGATKTLRFFVAPLRRCVRKRV